MNWWTRGGYALRSWLVKSFPIGTAAVSETDETTGKEQAMFAPGEYGNYVATSVPVYACSTKRADAMSSLPLRFYRQNRRGEREALTDHPLVDLLTKINPYWTVSRLMSMTEMSLCLWGQAFWILERGVTGVGRPRELWWAPPDRMKVFPDQQNYIKRYEYEYGGSKIVLSPQEVIWFRYPNPISEFAGLSPIAAARLSIDTGYDALFSNRQIFREGLQVGGMITPAEKSPPMTPETAKELEEGLAQRLKGVKRAHRWAILPHRMEMSEMGMSPKDAEFLGLMRWSLNDVCRVYGVPPPLVQDYERSTYSNMEQAIQDFWADTMVPEATMIAEEITEQLAPMFNSTDRIVAEFDLAGVQALQEDRAEVVGQMQTLWQMGVPLNRLLQEYLPNLLPQDEREGWEWGEEPWLPLTLTQPSAALAPTPADEDEPPPDELSAPQQWAVIIEHLKAARALPPPAEKDAPAFGDDVHTRLWARFTRQADQHEKLWKQPLEDFFRRQRDSVLSKLRGGRSAEDDGRDLPLDEMGRKDATSARDNPFDRAKWGKLLKRTGMPLLTVTFEDAGEDTWDDLKLDTEFDLDQPSAVRWLEGRSQRFARQVNETTWDALKHSLAMGMEGGESIGELAARVEHTFDVASRSRAVTIARTETISASNAGALEAAKQSGVVTKKSWLAALDERTRDTHRAAHGQTVKLDADFKVGGGEGPAPGQIGDGAEDIMCRCTVTFS